MPVKSKTLKARLKAQNRRLPHGYELVARKKRKTVTKRKATKKRR
jgi:hypothetical protein